MRLALDRPQLYDPSEELVAAVNVALTLRLPLLLTGPPGTGKTELARSLALQLHDGSEEWLFKVTVSSTADKSDVLYRYDELARLRDAYDREEGKPRADDASYLSLRGLGAAIAAAGGPEAPLRPIVPGRKLPESLRRMSDLVGAAVRNAASAEASESLGDFLPRGAPPPVVLIDEIDKAPRELPNDLLNELDRMTFDIPELGLRVALPEEAPWPVVIITSNAERPLPDAFLRRCVCFHLDPPKGDVLRRIIEAKLRVLSLLDGAARLPDDLVAFVARLQASPGVPENEKPGTARVLDFAVLLADGDRFGGRGLTELPEPQMRAALTALLPSPAAQKAALAEWEAWRTALRAK